MKQVITTRLTEEIKKDLILVAREEKLDKSMVLRRLLGKALKEWKRKEAIKKYKENIFSIEQAAQFAEMSTWGFLTYLQEKKITINYEKEDLERELRNIRWKKS